MARSLERKLFHTCTNNGVTAVISHATKIALHQKCLIQDALVREIVVETEKAHQIGNVVMVGLAHIGTPIFTFSSSERVLRSPWFTGTLNLLEELKSHVSAQGGRFEAASFFVPFSNGAEQGLHGLESQGAELRYVTTAQDFYDTFAIDPIDLMPAIQRH
jgi:hypothetical protein